MRHASVGPGPWPGHRFGRLYEAIRRRGGSMGVGVEQGRGSGGGILGDGVTDGAFDFLVALFAFCRCRYFCSSACRMPPQTLLSAALLALALLLSQF